MSLTHKHDCTQAFQHQYFPPFTQHCSNPFFRKYFLWLLLEMHWIAMADGAPGNLVRLSLLFSVCFSVIISKYKHQIQIFFFLDGKWVMMSLYYDDNPTVRVTLIYLLRILNISFTLLVTNLKTELGKQIIKKHSFWSKKVGWHDYYCPSCRPQRTLTFWVGKLDFFGWFLTQSNVKWPN